MALPGRRIEPPCARSWRGPSDLGGRDRGEYEDMTSGSTVRLRRRRLPPAGPECQVTVGRVACPVEKAYFEESRYPSSRAIRLRMARVRAQSSHTLGKTRACRMSLSVWWASWSR